VEQSFRVRTLWWLLVIAAAGAAAQDPPVSDGFESGDTGTWSSTFPRRCDDLDTFDRGFVPSRELHVAVTGSDSTGDGTEASPFATIGRAADEVTPGTAIRVHAGTYSGGNYLADIVGSGSAPIWIGGMPGESRPLIDGASEGLHLVRAKYVVVHDLEVGNAASNGINADDGGDYADPLASHHLVFRGLQVHDIGGTGNQDCLKLSGINDYAVILSSFARCGGGGSGSGVDQVGCHRGLIARNTFEDHSGNAVQTKGGSEDVEIRWNRFSEAGERSLNLGGSTGFTYFRPPLSTTDANAEARNLDVWANLFEGSVAPVAYVGCVGCVVANNTMIDPDSWILRILQETTSTPPYEFAACRDGVFRNNLVSFRWADLSTWLNIGPNTEPATFEFDHNLWYARDAPEHSQPALPVPETGGIYEHDPELDSAFHIGSTSPATGAGSIPAPVAGDLDGVCYGTPPSLGAFEAARKLAVTRGASHTGEWSLEVGVGSDCTDAETVTLADATVSTPVSITACESVNAGDGYTIAGSGNVTLTAGRSIALGDGFSVESGGGLIAAIHPPLSRTAFVQHTTSAGATYLSLSFWVDLDLLAIPSVDEMALLTASSRGDGWRIRLLVRTGPEIVFQVRDDLGTVHSSVGQAVASGWRQVAVSWEASPGASASLVLDANPPVTLSGLDTSLGKIHTIRWGAVDGILESTAGTLFLDDIVAEYGTVGSTQDR